MKSKAQVKPFAPFSVFRSLKKVPGAAGLSSIWLQGLAGDWILAKTAINDLTASVQSG